MSAERRPGSPALGSVGRHGHSRFLPRSSRQRRVVETHAAAAILGVQRTEFLGDVDSGTMGESTNEEQGSFWSAHVDEAAERLAAILLEERADVLTNRDHLRRVIDAARAEAVAAGVEVTDPERDFDTMGKPESLITAAVDVSAYIDVKRAAMRAHASQIGEQSPFLTMPDHIFLAAFGTEWAIRDGQGPGITETDLMAGLANTQSGQTTQHG